MYLDSYMLYISEAAIIFCEYKCIYGYEVNVI